MSRRSRYHHIVTSAQAACCLLSALSRRAARFYLTLSSHRIWSSQQARWLQVVQRGLWERSAKDGAKAAALRGRNGSKAVTSGHWFAASSEDLRQSSCSSSHGSCSQWESLRRPRPKYALIDHSRNCWWFLTQDAGMLGHLGVRHHEGQLHPRWSQLLRQRTYSQHKARCSRPCMADETS